MRQRLRNVVWRELPFSARRAIVGTLRTLDQWEDRVHRLWRSLIDSLDDSPAWLFVAVVGTIGVGLTILLFFSLTKDALAARSAVGLAQRVVEPANLPVHQTEEIDSRLCLETVPLKPPPYPAEFDFRGVMLADEPVRRTTRPLPERQAKPVIEEDFPAWGDLPELPPRREAVAERPRPTMPDFDSGRPEVDIVVDWLHQRPERRLASVEPTEVSARSAVADLDSRTRLAVLGAADRDGWSWFRERYGSIQIPEAYAGETKATSPVPEDLAAMDFTAIPSRAEVALQVELHAPEAATLNHPGRSYIVIRNAGEDTIRRLELREQTQPLELITSAEPPASLTDGVLSRELRSLRRGRDRTLSLGWFPQTTARRSVGAEIVGEAVVAALVQVERETEPAATPEPTPPSEPPPLPSRRPRVEPAAEPEPTPEPLPVRRPPKTRAKPPVTQPGLTCTVSNSAHVAVRSTTELSVAVRNTGDSVLHEVRIWVTLPENLAHRHGSRLEYTVGELAAGQTHQARLRLVGAQPGSATARVLAFAAEDVKS
ncbi:MAG: hypothetical protein SH850_05495, partial [Planctomycetaceae bacterium]|nr:hypothetical protein [Planctomycetaceae bacterium]